MYDNILKSHEVSGQVSGKRSNIAGGVVIRRSKDRVIQYGQLPESV
jgi:hypothetical protein